MTGIKHQTWETVIRFYASDPSMKKMLSLIDTILSSNHRFRLFPVVFLDSLVVSVLSDVPLFENCLHIRFDSKNNQFIFSSYSDQLKEGRPEWEKIYSAEEGIKNFDQIILKARWY